MFQMVGSDQDPAQLSSSLVLAGLVARGSPTLLDTHPQVYHQWALWSQSQYYDDDDCLRSMTPRWPSWIWPGAACTG